MLHRKDVRRRLHVGLSQCFTKKCVGLKVLHVLHPTCWYFSGTCVPVPIIDSLPRPWMISDMPLERHSSRGFRVTVFWPVCNRVHSNIVKHVQCKIVKNVWHGVCSCVLYTQCTAKQTHKKSFLHTFFTLPLHSLNAPHAEGLPHWRALSRSSGLQIPRP